MIMNCVRASSRPHAALGMVAVMSHHWILDVLADLRGFARRNDLNELAEHLTGTLALAEAEIGRQGRPPAEAAPRFAGHERG
jgi:hypothetical protein